LINDGSTDNTEEIIHSYSDIRIKYFRQQNRGQCASSNFGLSVSKGDYVKFFDADDILNESHIEEQIKMLDGKFDSLVSCAWGRFFNNDPSSTVFIPEPVWRNMESLDWIKVSLSQKYDMMGAWLWLIPRSLINETGGWDERLSLNNDFEFSMRLLTKVKYVLFASNAKLYYRSGNASLSGSATHKAYSDALLSTKLGLSYLISIENSSYTRKLAADRFKVWLFRIYPLYPDLQEVATNQIKIFGGSSKKYDGGLVFQIISFVLGWKTAKIIKEKLFHFGYKKLPFR
jgi:glycosyltransferase involved in cell wall biosynthesis